MTSKKAQESQTKYKLEDIELAKIDSNPWQPRTSAPTDEELGDLLNSIKAVGVRTPISVRPHPSKPNRFQLADGAMRVAVQRRLQQKTIRATIEPLTDRQMKILAIEQNVFIRLPDKDKRTAIFKLWESEFKTDEPTPGSRKDAEFTGIREMERETGMDHATITGHLQAYVTEQKLVGNQPAKATKEAVRKASSYDLQAIASLTKESPKAAAKIIEARTDERPVLRAQDIREVVKTVMAAPEKKREEIAQEIIKAHKEAQEQLVQAKRDIREEAVNLAPKDSPTVKDWQNELRQEQQEMLEHKRLAEDRKRVTMEERAVNAFVALQQQVKINATLERVDDINSPKNLERVTVIASEVADAMKAVVSKIKTRLG